MTDSIHTEAFLDIACSPAKQGGQKQFRMRIPWRRVVQGDNVAFKMSAGCGALSSRRIHVDPQELALFFVRTYLAMFREMEDVTIKFQVMKRKLTNPLVGDLGFYSRLSLVTLLASAKQTVSTDWDACIGTLVSMIESDRSLMVGFNSLQELYLHLHSSGLWSVEMLQGDPRAHLTPWGSPRSPGEEGILGRQSLPSIVHVALNVPRSHLRVFTDTPIDQVGTPPLLLSVSNGMRFDNSFLAIDTFFGKLDGSVSGDGKALVEEDTQAWSGEADLIATCAVPTWPLLLGNRQDLHVSLVVRTSPATVQYTKKLGIRMRVFEANLDSKNVHILIHAPTSSSMQRDQNPSPKPASATTTGPAAAKPPTVHLRKDGTVDTISIVSNFSPDSDESGALKAGAPIIVSQRSPCIIAALIGHLVHNFVFPYPVNGGACKTKIARKSSWIEVKAPTSNALQPGGFSYDPFPVVGQTANNLLAWGMGRTSIDRQPRVKLPLASSKWLESLFAMVMSRAERALNKDEVDESLKTALLQMKESMPLIYLASVGCNPKYPDKMVRSILLTEDKSVDTLVILNALRHDRDTGSVFMDAFVVPATPDVLVNKSFEKAAAQVMGNSPNERDLTISVSREEMALWKRLFPATIERCRTWEHGSDCEYKTGTIPLSTARGEVPICDCGKGKDAEQMPPEFKALAEFATRAAIPLISAVPYVEPMLSEKMYSDLDALYKAAISEQQTTGASNDSSHGSIPHRPASGRTVPVQSSTSSGLVGKDMDACGHCGTVKPGLKACSRCEKVKYCNHACQKAAWKAHKKECKR